MKHSLPALALAFSVVTACSGTAPEATDRKPAVNGSTIHFEHDQIPAALTSAPLLKASSAYVTLSGRLQWNEEHTVRVFSPFAGRVRRIIAQLGDHVAADSPLAVLDSADYGIAQSDYQKAAANLELAQHALERARDLHEHGIIARKDLEQAEADAAAANADAARTAQVLKLYDDRGDLVNQQLTLRSPITGVVVERSINPGQELHSDQSGSPQFVVTDPATLWIQLDAAEAQLASLQVGQPFTFRVAAYPDAEFHGKLLRVYDYVDPTTRTVKALGVVDNKDHRLKGEMFVTAQLPLSAADAPLAPPSAVLLLSDRHYVFVRHGDDFERHEVRVGLEQGEQIPVYEGLQADDQIVTGGALYLQTLLDHAKH